MNVTFAQMIDAARVVETEFTPSRAEVEAKLSPVVAHLVALGPAAAVFVRETYRGAGTLDALCVHLYKVQQTIS